MYLHVEAPASSIGELASAVLMDGSSLPSLKDASKVDKSHSERNAHRLFNRYGLALRVPISWLEVPVQSVGEEFLAIPYLKVTDYLKLLVGKYEQTLLGGLTLGEASEELCSTFWKRFETYQQDHVVYTQLSEEDRKNCVPIMVHGDKGRTLQKSPIFVCSFESVWGLPPDMLARCAYDNRAVSRKQFHDGRLSFTCQDRIAGKKRSFQDMTDDECTVGLKKHLDHKSNPKDSHQRHNSKGHSYLSRFLIAAIPSKMYNRNGDALPCLLREVAKQLTEVFETGIKHKSGTVLRFAFIACKGDAEWHWEAGRFTRSYHNTGVTNELPMCPQCEAGVPGLSFTDVSDRPAWFATMARSDPWDETPPLNRAPYRLSCPASLYKFDPFHVTKFGVFRDAVASSLIRLAAMTYFDFEDGASKSVAARLERAFSLYKLWTLAAGKNATLKKFTKANFNFEKYSQFAWVNAKGSEVTLLLMWVDFLLDQIMAKPLKQAAHRMPLQAMSQMVKGALNYVGIMHSHGVFLPAACAKLQVKSGLAFIRGYAWNANFCMERSVSGFRLRPKLHYMHHLILETQQQLDQGAQFALSSALWLCESNEDFIGRLARVSRRVSARTSALRTTQRYLVKARCLLERLLPPS